MATLVTTRRGLVSVVIPCYNQANFLPEAIESVLAQTYGRVEVVVVNDGSTDDTAAVASRYEWVRCISQPNGGQGVARNERPQARDRRPACGSSRPRAKTSK